MVKSDLVKIRFCRAGGVDWHVDTVPRGTLHLHKLQLEAAGWIVYVTDTDGSVMMPRDSKERS